MISDIKLKRCISVFMSALFVAASVIFLFRTGSILTKAADKSDGIIVSMGDSYSSGEGIEPFFGWNQGSIEKTVKNDDWLAHRSENAWSGMLTLPASDGTTIAMKKYDKDKKPDGNWYFVASSGATTGDINYSQTKEYSKNGVKSDKKSPPTLEPQIKIFDELKRNNKKADYVTLTLGGNDADFAGIMKLVALSPSYLCPNIVYNKIQDVYDYQLEDIKVSLGSVYRDIAKRAGEQSTILVAGYPYLLDQTGKGATVSKQEAIWVNQAVEDFNKAIEEEVTICQKSIAIEFIPVADAFENHEAYSDDTQKTPIAENQEDTLDSGEFINRVVIFAQSQDLKDSPPSAYSIHPNLRGAHAYAKCVQDKINTIENENSIVRMKPTEKPTEEANQTLQSKLNDLISEYGIASNETYTANTNVISDSNWTNREGIVSAKLSDLDYDGINELVVARLLGGNLNSYSESLEIEVYYYANDEVKSAGSYKFFTGDDFTQKQIDSFIHKIDKQRYIFIESDFAMYGTDGSAENSYDVLEYSDGKLSKKLRVYLETDFAYYLTSKWTEVTWDGDIENEREIFYSGYENNDLDSNFKRGEYKNSDNPIKDYFVDFGLSSTDDVFPASRITRFFNSDGSDKLFEITLSRETDLTKYTSSLTDYTDLDHSKSTTSAEKAAEWKELYISFLQKDKTYTNSSFDFTFVDVDENGIPELVTTGFAAAGTQMFWIWNEEVQSRALGYGEFKYIPSSKLIYCQYINHGIYSDNVYLFENQIINTLFSGTILPEENGFENPGWFIDDRQEPVSESEYQQKLNSIFDFSSAKGLDGLTSVSGEDIVQAIRDY